MINDQVTGADEHVDPERALALAYAPLEVRPGVTALFALDDMLARILRTTTEPVIGQMRLTWWYEALTKLDQGSAPAEPVLRALAAEVLPHGVTGTRLAALIDAWEVLLDPDTPKDTTLERYAMRGTILFGAAATILGASPGDPVAPAGRGWALADLALHVEDADVSGRAAGLARIGLDLATGTRWSSRARSLGAMAHLARLDLAVPRGQPIRRGAPGRVARVLWHRMTGR
jgi:phytoene synthase